jgi:hypothetical protein
VNSDGSFTNSYSCAGPDIVVRDDTGKVVSKAYIILDLCADVEEAKATAALAGLKIFSNICSTKVIMELDSLTTVYVLAFFFK